jgi:pyruvate dehydrogenase E2 component (dihydrolipoamide acetyltransferase)
MDVRLPKLGEGAEGGAVVSILVKEGDTVTKGQTVLELENEKAVAPIPSTAGGVVGRIHVKEGDKINVGQLLLSVTETGAAPDAGKTGTPAPARAAAPAPGTAAPEAQVEEAGPVDAEAEAPAENGPPPAASPELRRIARELGIDLRRVRGSERGGRIVMADLRAYVQRLLKLAAAPKTAGPAAKAAAPAEPIDFSKWGEISKKPMSPLRKTISRRMVENWNSIPHVTQFDEVDITDLLELRKKFAPEYEKKGARLTLTSFALKAVVAALKKHPIFNSSLDEVAEEVVLKEYFHIGLAVDTDQGLMVPVIRNVDKKSLFDLSKDISELADKARDRKLTLEEMKGGTFTISNQGGIGGAHFTPIVNKPEVAILGLGQGALKAVVRDKQIQQRLMMPVGLSYDHRVIDGGTAARFTVDLIEAFQSFKESDLKLG